MGVKNTPLFFFIIFLLYYIYDLLINKNPQEEYMIQVKITENKNLVKNTFTYVVVLPSGKEIKSTKSFLSKELALKNFLKIKSNGATSIEEDSGYTLFLDDKLRVIAYGKDVRESDVKELLTQIKSVIKVTCTQSYFAVKEDAPKTKKEHWFKRREKPDTTSEAAAPAGAAPVPAQA